VAPVSRVDRLRQGLQLLAVLCDARSTDEAADELGVHKRDVQRLLSDLRREGFQFARSAANQRRWYQLVEVPSWFAEALRALQGFRRR
jgi:biotin operon repressor